jgi:formimidoylglutamate deiminase
MAEVTFLADHAFLPDGWGQNVLIRVDTHGIIEAVEPNAGNTGGAERLRGATLPGLPNLHSHTFQRGMAGLAERRGPAHDSFWSWREVMYRFVRVLTPDDVEAIAAMAMVEMLEGGFTSLAEFHYLHHAPDGAPYANPAEIAERIAAAAARTGIGLTLLPVLYTYGGFGSQPSGDGQRRFLNDLGGYFRLHEASAKALRDLPGSVVGVAPHSLRAVSPEQLNRLVDALPDGPIHIHIAEQMKEVEDCLAWCGRRPVAWLADNVTLSGRWTLIHATHMDEGEVAAVAASGAVAGLCPITEANLGDGVFEGIAFLGHQGRIGVGSDSNVEITAAGELRMLEYSQRLRHRGRNLLAGHEGASTGETLYRAALEGGRQALAQTVGAIAPGQRADLVVLDTAHPAFASGRPVDFLDAYVFGAGSEAVATVIVAGKPVVSDGRHRGRDPIVRRYRETLLRIIAS